MFLLSLSVYFFFHSIDDAGEKKVWMINIFFSLRPISSAFVKTSGCFLGKSHGRLVFIDVE
ncbi:hypothetical protein, partial [Eisenbergiella massiliensis]|uniref:hypothetical protein n=1 Tax=Eisenbergiella massiliensis TaxID=1720294 RepID=UPI002493C095